MAQKGAKTAPSAAAKMPEPPREGAALLRRLRREIRGISRRSEKYRLLQDRCAELATIYQPRPQRHPTPSPHAEVRAFLAETKKLLDEIQQASGRVVRARVNLAVGGRDHIGKIDLCYPTPSGVPGGSVARVIPMDRQAAARRLMEMLDRYLAEIEVQLLDQWKQVDQLRGQALAL